MCELRICANCKRRTWCEIPGDDHIDCELWAEEG